jgi:biopolymer transport protein ExbD
VANWDVFHSDRLEVERGLSTAEVRAALLRGELVDDDLVRPAGTTAPWTRFADAPSLFESEPESLEEPASRAEVVDSGDVEFAIIDDEEDEDDDPFPVATVGPFDEGEHAVIGPSPQRDGGDEPYGEYDLNLRDRGSSSVEVVTWDDDLDGEYDPQDEDEAAAEFTLSRGSAERVEELDLAAMVDVAFQLVLFFLVTATTVLYKSLEVPKPNPENNPAAAAQGRTKTMDDLKSDFILVEIDQAGAVKIDREPVAAELSALVERLRAQRDQTRRQAMLLSADFSTPHRSAVLAYDAANEIGLGIAIARPAQAQPPPPVPPPPAAPGAL